MKQFLHSPWIAFIGLVVAVAAKCSIWHMQFFADKQVPLFPIMCSAVLLASVVFLCRRCPWWMLLALLAMDVWLFANFAYERAWGRMLTVDMIHMAGNLQGYESSMLLYWHKDMLRWTLLPDLVYAAVLPFWRRQQTRHWRVTAVILGLFILSVPLQQRATYIEQRPRREGYNNNTGLARWWYVRQPLFNLYHVPYDIARDAFLFQTDTRWERPYLRQAGILNYGPALCVFESRYRHYERTLAQRVEPLTEQEEELMDKLTAEEPDFAPQRNLIILLVESLESWAVDYPAPDKGYVMPNLHRFIAEHPVYYSGQMHQQICYGGSSDGQLLLMTGLCPVKKGVSVTLYGDQPFPNYAHLFPHSVTLDPSPGSWNKNVVFPNYGVQVLEQSDSIHEDAGLIHRLNAIDYKEPWCCVVLTVSSHVPFSKSEEVPLDMPADMPAPMARYLKCLRYLDDHLGTFLSRVDSDPVIRNSDIVITGDHTIFYTQDWQQMQDYARSKGIDCLGEGVNTCPMMVYSPTITAPIHATEPTYQMDIYPTIMGLIGCEQPAWRGLGIDLLHQTEDDRLLSTEAAQTLSDKLIRMKYFE